MTMPDLEALYADGQQCAQLVGLEYTSDDTDGYTRRKHGSGFSFLDKTGKPISDKQVRQQIVDLVIPPAWQQVWICPKPNGHILATGIDERGRKQYIYNPQWRTVRDGIKYYRLISFGQSLHLIRKRINADLARTELDRQKVLAVMLWLLDNTYIRVGNEQYYEENDSVGLTTLTDKHLVVAGSVTTLAFRGKSGKDHQITFDNAEIARVIDALTKQRGERLFRYKTDSGYHAIEPADINEYLHEITNQHISAKDFRTWGGTLMAFHHLETVEQLPADKTPKDDKVVVQAIDAAAQVLGNTRSVARSSYVHPDLLGAYGTKHFHAFYKKAQAERKKIGLDKLETELLYFLERLFAEEFDLTKQAS